MPIVSIYGFIQNNIFCMKNNGTTDIKYWYQVQIYFDCI